MKWVGIKIPQHYSRNADAVGDMTLLYLDELGLQQRTAKLMSKVKSPKQTTITLRENCNGIARREE